MLILIFIFVHITKCNELRLNPVMFNTFETHVRNTDESDFLADFLYEPFVTKKTIYYIKTKKNCELWKEPCHYFFFTNLDDPDYKEHRWTQIDPFTKLCTIIGPVASGSAYFVLSVHFSESLSKCEYFSFNDENKEISDPFHDYPYLLDYYGISWNNKMIVYAQNSNDDLDRRIVLVNEDGTYTLIPPEESLDHVYFPFLRRNFVVTNLHLNDPYKYRFDPNEDDFYFIERKLSPISGNVYSFFKIDSSSLTVKKLNSSINDKIHDAIHHIYENNGSTIDIEKCDMFDSKGMLSCYNSDDDSFVVFYKTGHSDDELTIQTPYMIPYENNSFIYVQKTLPLSGNIPPEKFVASTCRLEEEEEPQCFDRFIHEDLFTVNTLPDSLPLKISRIRRFVLFTSKSGAEPPFSDIISINGFNVGEGSNIIDVSSTTLFSIRDRKVKLIGSFFNHLIAEIRDDDNSDDKSCSVLISRSPQYYSDGDEIVSKNTIRSLRSFIRLEGTSHAHPNAWLSFAVGMDQASQVSLFSWTSGTDSCFPSCSETGSKGCDLDSLTCICKENFKLDRSDYNTCNSCSLHYYGITCSKYCYGPTTCFGNGECDENGECLCDENYDSFSNCENCVSGRDINYGCQKCENGYELGGRENICIETECFGILSTDVLNVCSGHGNCNSMNNCSCEDGYDDKSISESCNGWKCFEYAMNSKKVCSGGSGQCFSPNQCKCFEGYNGKECEFAERKKQSFWFVSLFVVSCVVPCCILVVIVMTYMSVLKKNKKSNGSSRRGNDGEMTMTSFVELEEDENDDFDDNNVKEEGEVRKDLLYDDTEYIV